jgi:hypothetical protein
VSTEACPSCDLGYLGACTCGRERYAVAHAEAVRRDSCPLCGELGTGGVYCAACREHVVG